MARSAIAVGTDVEEVPLTVCVKVRPMLDWESLQFERSCVRAGDGDNTVTVGNDRTFVFDRVLSPECSGEATFEAVGRPILDYVLDGFNATILAYGQTGAGKTYTMSDLTRRCIEYLKQSTNVEKVRARGDQLTWSVAAMEIFKENVFDLLDPAHPKLNIRETSDGDVFVAGLRVAETNDIDDVLGFVESATRERSTASTNINATSSRSHCIATICLTHCTMSGSTITGKLTLVDLAGSERMKKAHGSGAAANTQTADRMKEGIHINSGLLALGNVIQALSAKKGHIPFRSSKLTRILQPSLAGNSRTVMIACIASGDRSMDETLNTLKYADRARQLRLAISRNVKTEVLSGDNAEGIIAQLRAEVESLRAMMNHREGVTNHSSSEATTCMQSGSADSSNFQHRVISLEEELAKEKRFSRQLEEDLYRAEFCTMKEVERSKELERQVAALKEQLEAAQGRHSSIVHADMQTSATCARATGSSELEMDIVDKEDMIHSLEAERETAQRSVEEYQVRLRAVLQDKVRLQQELERAELRLEQTQMEQSKREQQRAQLKASYEAKVRAAEVSAAEYRRRVREAESLARCRAGDEDRVVKLKRELAALKEVHQRQKDSIKADQLKLSKLVVDQQTAIDVLNRKLREVKSNSVTPSKQQQLGTPRRVTCAIAQSVTTVSPIPQTHASHDSETSTMDHALSSAMESLEKIEEELREAESERESIKSVIALAQQSSESARWRRALKGFQLRLTHLEKELQQEDWTDAERRTAVIAERRDIQEKIVQLEELRPARDDALEQLRDVEERIDSFQSARNYKLKIVRALQREQQESNMRRAAAATPGSPWNSISSEQVAAMKQTISKEFIHQLEAQNDTIRVQASVIEELNQKIDDQALLLQQLLPVSKEASRRMLYRGLDTSSH